jgi:hypothetical protein
MYPGRGFGPANGPSGIPLKRYTYRRENQGDTIYISPPKPKKPVRYLAIQAS